MCPIEVGFKRLDEDRTLASREINVAFTVPWSQPKDALLAKRDRHDGPVFDQPDQAVSVLADRMTKLTLVPVDQDPIQLSVDRLFRPTQQWFKQLGSRQCSIYSPGVQIVSGEGLLPSRSLHETAVHSDNMIFRRMYLPERLGLVRIQEKGVRQPTGVKFIHFIEVVTVVLRRYFHKLSYFGDSDVGWLG